MNSRAKISLSLGLRQIFQESFNCLPFVFKKISRNFASIWFPFVILCIITFNIQFPHASPEASLGLYFKQMMSMGLYLLGHCFIIFIVPYYVFVFLNQKENKPTQDFWLFLSENMFPLVVNHIKTTITICLYLLLLIIPGIIKSLQLSLVTQSTFFDENYKTNKISALKASQKTTKNFLTGMSLLILITVALPFALNPLEAFLKLMFAQQMIPLTLIDISKTIITFYINCFGLILMTQAYFVLKRYSQ